MTAECGGNGSDEIEAIRAKHQLLSAYRCSCGWEGDDAFIHVVDALGLLQVGWCYAMPGTSYRGPHLCREEPKAHSVRHRVYALGVHLGRDGVS